MTEITVTNYDACKPISVVGECCSICGEPAISQLAFSSIKSCEPCVFVFDWIAHRLVEESELTIDQISPESAFAKDIRLDSLSMIELIMDLEKQFSVRVSDNAVADIRTVKDVIRCVRRQTVATVQIIPGAVLAADIRAWL